MENNNYPEFKKVSEEVNVTNQVDEKFDVDEYEATSKKYKTAFFINLILTIVIFILDIVYLIVTLSRGDKFTGLDFVISIGSLVLDVLTATFTVRFYDRWKSYE